MWGGRGGTCPPRIPGFPGIYKIYTVFRYKLVTNVAKMASCFGALRWFAPQQRDSVSVQCFAYRSVWFPEGWLPAVYKQRSAHLDFGVLPWSQLVEIREVQDHGVKTKQKKNWKFAVHLCRQLHAGPRTEPQPTKLGPTHHGMSCVKVSGARDSSRTRVLR